MRSALEGSLTAQDASCRHRHRRWTCILAAFRCRWRRKDEKPRPPDILLVDEGGVSPQYDGNVMLRETGSKPLTRQLINEASKYVVKGCFGPDEDFRGVSTFDMTNPRARGVEWFCIPEGTEIPAGLAITPKNDMPFPLFLQHLKGFEAVLQRKQG